MKNILLLVLCALSISSFAQKNELSTIYQLNTDKNLGKGLAFNYYRHVASNKAMGIKVFYTEASQYTNLKAIGIDLTHRWDLMKYKNIRFMFESGIAALQTIEESTYTDFDCNCIFIRVDSAFAPTEELRNYLYFGYTAGLGFEIQFLKLMTFGVGYNLNNYMTNHKRENKTVSRSNFQVNVGVKF